MTYEPIDLESIRALADRMDEHARRAMPTPMPTFPLDCLSPWDRATEQREAAEIRDALRLELGYRVRELITEIDALRAAAVNELDGPGNRPHLAQDASGAVAAPSDSTETPAWTQGGSTNLTIEPEKAPRITIHGDGRHLLAFDVADGKLVARYDPSDLDEAAQVFVREVVGFWPQRQCPEPCCDPILGDRAVNERRRQLLNRNAEALAARDRERKEAADV